MKKKGGPHGAPYIVPSLSPWSKRAGYPFYIILNRGSRLFSFSFLWSCWFQRSTKKGCAGDGARRKGGADFVGFKAPLSFVRPPRTSDTRDPLRVAAIPTDGTSTRNEAKPTDRRPSTLPGNFRTSAGIIDSVRSFLSFSATFANTGYMGYGQLD